MDDSKTGIESLEIWQMAIRFSVDVCKLILPKFPPEEKWGLTSQLRRSVQSIPANIAEGYGRYYYTETVRFCYIARGSSKKHTVIWSWQSGWGMLVRSRQKLSFQKLSGCAK